MLVTHTASLSLLCPFTEPRCIFLRRVTDDSDSTHPRTSQSPRRMVASGAPQPPETGLQGAGVMGRGSRLRATEADRQTKPLCGVSSTVEGLGLEMGLLKVSRGKKRVGQQEK